MVGVAVKVTDAPAQLVWLPAVIAMLAEGTSVEFTVIWMLLLVAVAGDTQLALLVITTVTILLLVKVVDVKLALLVPAFTPFTFHWYEGLAPPLVGVAVNVTEVPVQIVCDPRVIAMLTEETSVGFTVIWILLLVAVAGDTQPALLVITTVTILLLAKVVDVKVAEFVPAFTPFIFH